MEDRAIINEGQNYKFRLKYGSDLTGKTIEVFIYPMGDPENNGTLVGSVNGAAADINMFPVLDFKNAGVEGGEQYYLEAWAEKGTSDATLVFPNEDKTFIIEVQDRYQF